MPYMLMKIITGRYHHDLEEALCEDITRRRAGDPLSPIHVLVGSNLLGTYLRKRLALNAGGHINVHFLTFADMVDRAVEFKMPALALTDHGNLFGAMEFYTRCRSSGLGRS